MTKRAAGRGRDGARSIVDTIRSNAEAKADAPALRFLAPGHLAGERGVELNRGQLDLRARTVAATLQESAIAGERVIVALPPGPDFVAAYLGCLYAGAVAVPCAPSAPGDSRFAEVGRDCEPAAVLVTAADAPTLRELWSQGGGPAGTRWIPVDGLDAIAAADWTPVAVRPEDLATIQYTSGSTGTPKGVVVSSAGFMAQLETFGALAQLPSGSSVVSWMPVYHALGLGHLLLSQLSGGTGVFLTPEDFVAEPYRWLRAISDTPGPLLGGGPNFAYDRCVDLVSDEQRAGLDLSGWDVALCAGERVQARTLNRFADAFAPAGFRREALFPAYGLTETMQAVAAARRPGTLGLRVNAEALERGTAQLAGPGDDRIRELVGVGRPGPNLTFLIVDPVTGSELTEGEVGELWICGPVVCDGYWQKAAQTSETFQGRLADGRGPYLRTGDLAFLRGGELFLCGRSREVIILHGKNYQPQDVESAAAAAVPELSGQASAAFSVDSEEGELLVVVQAVGENRPADPDALADRIRRAVVTALAAEVHEVLLVEAAAVPRTASGKIQRRACRQAYLDGRLAPLARARVQETAGPADGPDTAAAALAVMVAALPAEMRSVAVGAEVRRRVAHLAGAEAGELAEETVLGDLGLDSMRLMTLRQGLLTDFGVSLPLSHFSRGTIGSTVAAAVAALTPPAPAGNRGLQGV
ncbi:AMP-binding protein [Streptomyces inhibens]|uniref:AMP-binding protein n=1 Tax=Streptomyces inhibens TaxID=2293571 RepID=UPI001EE72216|nr:AMP-binding protein [Streptomyces inhibens]UKY51780.1 AMP-binding protein [Streptomyces inhibens]